MLRCDAVTKSVQQDPQLCAEVAVRRASSCELTHRVETERGKFRTSGVGKEGKRKK